MNRAQQVACVAALLNLLLLGLFPPYDDYTLASPNLPIFGGFKSLLSEHPQSQINASLLILEIIVVLVNLSIALLLLRDRDGRPGFGAQNTTLLLTGINLLLVLLFPPYEYFFAVTRATLPTFEGFHFIFGDNPDRVIVTTLLYLEVVFVLVNGGLIWLLLRKKSAAQLAAEQGLLVMLTMQKKARTRR